MATGDEGEPRRRGFEERFPRLHHFWTRRDAPWPVVRDLATGAVIVGLFLGILWVATGQPLDRSPVVVVESGSMMHCDGALGQQRDGDDCKSSSFGRLGTIDPGDLIFVRDIDSRKDVRTQAGGGDRHFGKSGDVIIFHGGGRPGTPVIHRALFYVEVDNRGTTTRSDDLYTIEELGVRGERHIPVERLAHMGIGPTFQQELEADCRIADPEEDISGFVTRGDNNAAADVPNEISFCPIRAEWILGKARGEVPWIGLLKLKFTDISSGTSHYDNAPKDLKRMMLVTVTLLIGGPIVADIVVKRRRTAQEADEEDAEGGDGGGKGPGGAT